MKAIIALTLVGLLSVPLMAAEPAADFYIAPGGNDGWSGKMAAPNAGATDGPFATFERAQKAVRELRAAQPGRNTPVTVVVRGGLYALQRPIEFTPADSGTEQSPTVYAAYPNERPIFSAGRRITGWKADAQGRWTVELPDVKSGEWNFIQLFVDGERRMRPRLPGQDWLQIADQMEPSGRFPGRGFDRFKFAPGDLKPEWANLKDVEVLATQVWTMARLRIDSIDPAANVVNFTGATSHNQYWSALKKGNRYLVENVKEALSRPGEWYLDRPTGVLTYIPRPGETIESTTIIAPRLESALHFRGDLAGKKWVVRITLRGLTFADVNWATPPTGNSFEQAEANIPAAVTFAGARDCAMEDCAVTRVGTYAIEFAAACRGNRVERCRLTDLGAGGVKIGLRTIERNEELLTSHQRIADCVIAHAGRLHPAAIGVWIGQSPYNVVEHNEIADLYYTGVSVGWTWGYGDSAAHHNLITGNRIHHVGQGVLSDMGGIYTLGVSPGSELRRNYIYDVDAFDYGGWGIYFDEGTTGMLAEGNIVLRTKTGGFHQHYGKENTFRNNIIAFSLHDQVQRTRVEPHLSFTFERNIVIFDTGKLLGSNWSGDKYKLDRNVYWRVGGKGFDFAGASFADWQKKGQDAGSVIADPMLTDPQNGDFRLKPGSPAEKMGFVPIDPSKAGPRPATKPVELAPPAFPTRKSR